jgi:putative heme iron utilization protein
MSQDDYQSPRTLARFILRETLFGSLGTEGERGYPFVSIVGLAAMSDGAPAILLSNQARHTLNVRKDPRVSLLLLEKPQAEDPLAVARLTVSGAAEPIDKELMRQRYLMRHPEAIKYAEQPDYVFWRVNIDRGHLIGAFGRTSDLTEEDLIGGGAAKP